MSLTFDGVPRDQVVERPSVCRYLMGLIGDDVEGMKKFLRKRCRVGGLKVLSSSVTVVGDGRHRVMFEVESGRGIV